MLVQSGDQGDLDTKKRALLLRPGRRAAVSSCATALDAPSPLAAPLPPRYPPPPLLTCPCRPQRHQGRLQHAHEDADVLVQDLL